MSNEFKLIEKGEIAAGKITTKELLKILKKENPKTVLELGGGTGALTKIILENSSAVLDTYEHTLHFQGILNNQFAREYRERFNILLNYMELPPRRSYDLIVVDAGKGRDGDVGFPKLIAAYLASLDDFKVIVVEGQRKAQKYNIIETIWPRFLYRAEVTNNHINPSKGCTVFYIKPSSSFIKKLWNHFKNRNSAY